MPLVLFNDYGKPYQQNQISGMVKVKLISESYFEAICKLYKIAFEKEPDYQLLKWKYFDSPYETNKLLGAFQEDELVGFCAILEERIAYLGSPIKTFKYVDIMVNPKIRKAGIGKQLIASLKEFTTEGDSKYLSYGIGSPIVTKIFNNYGYQFLGKVQNLFKPNFLLRLKAVVGQYQGVKREEVTISSSLNDLFEGFTYYHDRNEIEIYRSKKLLEWKIRNPRYSYVIIQKKENSNLSGYLILSISKYRIANIIDINAIDDNPKVKKFLLKQAEVYVLKNQLKALVIMTNQNSKHYQFFISQGFWVNKFKKGPLRSTLDFNVSKNEQLADSALAANWNLLGINYDDV